MKTCSVCGVEKPLHEFGKNAATKDGVSRMCKKCACEKSRRWAAANSDKVKVRMRAWRESNAEHKRRYAKKYYADNREARQEYTRKYVEANPARAAAASARWARANADHVAAREKAYRQARQGRETARSREWRAANPSRAKAISLARTAKKKGATVAKLPHGFEQQLFDQQNGWCPCCGADLNETGYHVDHIVPLAKGGDHRMDNLQLLTPTCNLSKGAKDWDEYLNVVWRERYADLL